MEILSIGINHTHGRHFRIDRPQGCGTWLLLLVKTSSFMQVNGERLELPPESMVIFSPGHPQLYGALDEHYTDDWMHFMLGPEDKALFERHPLPFDTPLVLHSLHEASDLLRKLCYEFHARRPYRDEYLQSCFSLLVLVIHQDLQSREVPAEGSHVPHADRLMTLRGYIRAGAYLDRNVDDMARDFLLGRSNLQHLYRRCFGTTIREDLLEARLFMARHYLATTSLSVAEIARTCGYDSEPHFMTVFRRRTGMTPGHFRNSL